jgi:hypothetical protein
MWKRPCREIVRASVLRDRAAKWCGTNERLRAPGAPGEKGGGVCEREIHSVCAHGGDKGSEPWSEGTLANVSGGSTLLVGRCAFARAACCLPLGCPPIQPSLSATHSPSIPLPALHSGREVV